MNVSIRRHLLSLAAHLRCLPGASFAIQRRDGGIGLPFVARNPLSRTAQKLDSCCIRMRVRRARLRFTGLKGDLLSRLISR